MVEPNKTTVSDNTENGAHNMVRLIIDNCEVVVPERTTILDAAKSVGIQIHKYYLEILYLILIIVK